MSKTKTPLTDRKFSYVTYWTVREGELRRWAEELECKLAEVRAATIEECAREIERWPLDPFKMEDSARCGEHGLGNAIAGTCNALVAHLRALDAARRKP